VTQLNGRRRGALYFYVVEQAASSLILAGGQSGEMRFAACLSLTLAFRAGLLTLHL